MAHWAADLYVNRTTKSRPASFWAYWATCWAWSAWAAGCTCRPVCPAAGCSPEPAVAWLQRRRVPVSLAPRRRVRLPARSGVGTAPRAGQPDSPVQIARSPARAQEQKRKRGGARTNTELFSSKLLTQISTVSSKIPAIDPWLLDPTDPRRNSRNDQGSITNRVKNRNRSQEHVFGENSESKRIRERFEGGLIQSCSQGS